MVNATLVLHRILVRILIKPQIDRPVRLEVPNQPNLILSGSTAGTDDIIKSGIHKRSDIVLSLYDEKIGTPK